MMILQIMTGLFIGITVLMGMIYSVAFYVRRQGKPEANRSVALLLLCGSISLLSAIWIVLPLRDYFPISMVDFLILAVGPLLYIYTLQLTQQTQIKHSKIRHFLILIPGFLLSSAPVMLADVDWLSYSQFILHGRQPLTPMASMMLNTSLLFWIMWIAQTGYYVYLVNKVLRAHRKTLCDNYSSHEHLTLNWLRYLFTLYFVTSLLALLCITIAYSPFSGTTLGEHHFYFMLFYTISCYPAIVLIISIGYLGLRQPTIFSGAAAIITNENNADSENHTEESEAKYERTSFTNEEAEHYRSILVEHMEEEKPYLDSELTLNELASQIGIRQPLHLTQLLNQTLKKNFFEFVNEYRLEAAKVLLTDNDCPKRSILDIAYESGFNSKSSFYNVFKSYTGMTPTVYRKQAKALETA